MRYQAKAVDAKSKGLKWPNMQQLGDPIRAMVVCGRGKYEQPMQVFDTIESAFKVQVRKVNLRASNRPPDMCEE